MIHDQIFKFKGNGVELNLISTPLNFDKEIYLLSVFEEDYSINKKFLRNKLVLIDNQILTSAFCDTVHFFEEIKLFDFGNKQNKYLDVTEYKNTKNLKLKYNGEKNVFLSKSEAMTMNKIFNMSFSGYSIASTLEKEYRFTAQELTKLLHSSNILARR